MTITFNQLWLSVKEKSRGFFSGWFWNFILFPFLAVRAVLLLFAWLATYLTPNPSYPDYTLRGYYLVPYPYIDMWTKWDALHYFSIVKRGYIVPEGFPNSSYNNLVFFPLYPSLVKFFGSLLPEALQRDAVFLVIGLVISNLAFLAAAAVLYLIVRDYIFDDKTAQRTIMLLLVYPASFFMTSFYTEGLFLCLVVCGYYAALKQKWALSLVLAALASLTRIQGIMLLLPIAWLYMQSRHWKFSRIKADILWFLMAPAALFSYFYYLYLLTGRPFAIIEAEKPWGRDANFTLERLFKSIKPAYAYQIARIDAFMCLLFLVAAIWMLFKFKDKSYGIFSLAMMVIPLVADKFDSMTRYVCCIFPVYILLAYYCKNEKIYTVMKMFFFALLIFYWVGWQLHYWIS